MRHGKDTKEQATKLIEAMRKGGIGFFHINHFGLKDRENIQDLVRMAKDYARIQEHDCNGTKTKSMETKEVNLESRISKLAASYGLRANFRGDPRGFCVKLHEPAGQVHNTWGGRESGYGIG